MMLRREISYTDLTTAAGLSTEETLFVSRLRANEDAAYDELVREYHTYIYHVARRMLNDPGEAADVTQDNLRQGIPEHRAFPWDRAA